MLLWVHLQKLYEARHPSITCCVAVSLFILGSEFVFMHLNSCTFFFPFFFFFFCNCLVWPVSFFLFPFCSPPFLSSSLRNAGPPGLLDQRAFLWDHLERPVEVEDEKERGGTRAKQGRSESLGEGGMVEKKFFMSRSAGTRAHTQQGGTQFSSCTHTSMYKCSPCFAAETTFSQISLF